MQLLYGVDALVDQMAVEAPAGRREDRVGNLGLIEVTLYLSKLIQGREHDNKSPSLQGSRELVQPERRDRMIDSLYDRSETFLEV